MRTITTVTKVYSFEELSEEGKLKAISDHIDFWIEMGDMQFPSDDLKRAYQEADQMQTPWFLGEMIFEYCKEEIIEEIKINEYEFTIDGEII